MGSKTLLQQNYPVLDWRYGLTQVDPYNGHKMVVCVCEVLDIGKSILLL